jgi:type IV pilus assembly protein PilQ
MKLPALLTALCLAAPALLAQGAETPPRSVTLGGYGVIERSQPGQRPSDQGRWHGFPISVSLHKAPLPDVVRTFAKLAGFNLVLDPRVQGSVTVELKDVPWDQALYLILKTHGMGAEIDGRLWVVAPR